MCCLYGEGQETHYWQYDSTCYDGNECWDNCGIIPSAWVNITYPEGLYELAGVFNEEVTLDTFTITFNDVNASAEDILSSLL